jgi:hypothetical protein
MRKLLVLAALLLPTVSFAQFQVGARVGFAPAMGDAQKDFAMSDSVKSQIPLQLDAAYKVTKDIAVGGYFSYGIGQAECDEGVDCSANIMRFGVQGLYTFNSLQLPLVPWAGVGFGYEIASGEVGGVDIGSSGFELLNLQAGGDYKVNEKFAVGPYVQFSLGQYSKAEFDGESQDIPSDAKAMHQWFGFGIRGKFDL